MTQFWTTTQLIIITKWTFITVFLIWLLIQIGRPIITASPQEMLTRWIIFGIGVFTLYLAGTEILRRIQPT